uniref:G_PROTEIN_RECEP_F1_2 domain-containing protein n=1 Tax=Macrostomum lignano TaxID=282301 RepID=A0A1I8FAG9_9PLAT
MSQLPQLGSTLPDELLFVSTTAAATAAANATEPEYSTPVMGLLGFLASVASFVTVVGNLLVITAFFVERQLRSATNYFIASLAITDLLIGMFSMNLYTLGPLGRFVCNMWLSLDYTACLTSQYTVFCITVDRFCSVKIPAKYRKWRTERKVQLMVAATWVLPAMLFVPSTFAWPYLSSKVRSEDACYAEFSEDPVYNTVLTICYFWVTLVAMIALYIGIYRVALNLARKSEAKRQKQPHNHGQPDCPVRHTKLAAAEAEAAAVGGGGRGSGSAGGGEAGKSPQRPLIKAAGGGGGGGDVTAAAGGGSSSRLLLKSRAGGSHDARKVSKKDKKKSGNNAGGGGGGGGGRRAVHSQSTSYRSGLSSDYCSSRAEDDRSSSPALPSDSDNGLHTPEPTSTGAGRATTTGASGARRAQPQQFETANDRPGLGPCDRPGGTWSVRAPPPPPSPPSLAIVTVATSAVVSQKLTASNDSDYHTASGLSFENAALDANGHSGAVSLADTQQQQPQLKTLQFSLCAPSDEFEGLRYIDEESIRSNPSIDSMRLLIELLPKHSQILVNDRSARPGSPIWKRRPSYEDELAAAAEAAAVQTRVDLNSGERDRVVTSVVELPLPQPVRRTAQQSTQTVGDDEIEVIQCGAEERRKQLHLPTLAQSFRDATRRGCADRQKKKQSRTENRARKALKTITLILGAFVVCWTPYHIFILIRSICQAQCLNKHLFNLGYWLCYLNSPINPFCYALANAHIGEAGSIITAIRLRPGPGDPKPHSDITPVLFARQQQQYYFKKRGHRTYRGEVRDCIAVRFGGAKASHPDSMSYRVSSSIRPPNRSRFPSCSSAFIPNVTAHAQVRLRREISKGTNFSPSN